MTLTPGTRLGAYEIISALGAGGMGEVYRARDTKLGRSVALKVLPDAVAGRPDRIARLEREAQSLAALKHPYIATLYGMEEAENQHFLVMELVEGETLTARIRRGPMPLAAALTTAIQIADALAAAHRTAIVHRDLKPDNVMITKGGAKLLDFGIAKASDSAVTGENASLLPTTPPGITEPGAILGTFQYMAPEQIEGHTADERTDLFAFGCVLFEMLTGRKAFEGETQATVIAATMHAEPPPVSTLQPAVPRSLDRVIQKCLAKDPEDRWQSARDLHDSLQWIAEPDAIQLDQRASWLRAIRIAGVRFSFATLAATLIALVAALVVAAIATWSLRSDGSGTVERQTTRTVIPLAMDSNLALGSHSPAVVISPDGRRIAYVGRTGDDSQVYLRSIEQLEAAAVDGTRGSSIAMPFFSPDGEWLGFSADGQLMKVAIGGGTPVPITKNFLGVAGASWAPDGDIVLHRVAAESLIRIPASGAEPQTLTVPNRAQRERSHRLAEVLPGGKAVLFIVGTAMIESWDDASIAVLSLDTGEYRVVLVGGTNPHYSRSGHLVYARAGNILAAPFDLAALQVTGPPVVAVRGVATSSITGQAEFSLSQNGSLVYAPGRAWGADRRLAWVDRSGKLEPLLERQGAWEEPRISPDGRRLALDADTAVSHIWIADLIFKSMTRLTVDGDNNGQPVWAPDSAHVAFWRVPPGGGRSDAVLQIADGSQPATRLTARGEGGIGLGGWLPRSFSRDGKLLSLERRNAKTGWDTYLLSLDGERAPEPFLQTDANEFHASFSPDGHWVVYQSDRSGRPEIYVSPVRGAFRGWRASTDGGTQPVWNANGKELVYRNQDQMMAIEVQTEPTIAFGKPTMLFKRTFPNPGNLVRDFDLSPDGQRFVVVDYSTAMLPPTELILVQHWDEELKRLVPTK